MGKLHYVTTNYIVTVYCRKDIPHIILEVKHEEKK